MCVSEVTDFTGKVEIERVSTPTTKLEASHPFAFIVRSSAGSIPTPKNRESILCGNFHA